jgi:hypothetical protein
MSSRVRRHHRAALSAALEIATASIVREQAVV